LFLEKIRLWNRKAEDHQEYSKACVSCGAELYYYRERGHQHWNWTGNDVRARTIAGRAIERIVVALVVTNTRNVIFEINLFSLMKSLGVEWYQYFWDGYLVYLKDNQISYELEITPKQWSNQMFGFLEEMAKDMNYHVKKEETTIKRKRFDMVWRSSDRPLKTIYIEHENQNVKVALEEEVRKLANYRANLHICITYIGFDEYPGKKFALETKKILEEVGYNEEFLLVLGSENKLSPTDWVCHRLYPKKQLKSEMLVLPASIPLTIPLDDVEEEETTKVEAWMINRLRIWKRIHESGGSVSRSELHAIAGQVGMDNRGLGGFFTGQKSSLYWKKNRVYLSAWAATQVKKLGKKVD